MTLTREQALENLGADEVAHRQEAERVWLAQHLAYQAYDAAFRTRRRDEADDVSDAHPDVAPLKAAFELAEKVWHEFETNGDVLTFLGSDEPRRCALTNFIIHTGDHFVENRETRVGVLVDALGLEYQVLSALICAHDDDPDSDDEAANDDEAA